MATQLNTSGFGGFGPLRRQDVQFDPGLTPEASGRPYGSGPLGTLASRMADARKGFAPGFNPARAVTPSNPDLTLDPLPPIRNDSNIPDQAGGPWGNPPGSSWTPETGNVTPTPNRPHSGMDFTGTGNAPHSATDFYDTTSNQPHGAMDFTGTGNAPHRAMDFTTTGNATAGTSINQRLPIEGSANATPPVRSFDIPPSGFNPLTKQYDAPPETGAGKGPGAINFSEMTLGQYLNTSNTGGGIWSEINKGNFADPAPQTPLVQWSDPPPSDVPPLSQTSPDIPWSDTQPFDVPPLSQTEPTVTGEASAGINHSGFYGDPASGSLEATNSGDPAPGAQDNYNPDWRQNATGNPGADAYPAPGTEDWRQSATSSGNPDTMANAASNPNWRNNATSNPSPATGNTTGGTGATPGGSRWDYTSGRLVPNNNATGAQNNWRAANALEMWSQSFGGTSNAGQDEPTQRSGFGTIGRINPETGFAEQTGVAPANWRPNIPLLRQFVYGPEGGPPQNRGLASLPAMRAGRTTGHG
jgi:hypothetical protein